MSDEPFRFWRTHNILADDMHGLSAPEEFDMPYCLVEAAEQDMSLAEAITEALNNAYECGVVAGKKLPRDD
jgi:hypothetical protein